MHKAELRSQLFLHICFVPEPPHVRASTFPCISTKRASSSAPRLSHLHRTWSGRGHRPPSHALNALHAEAARLGARQLWLLLLLFRLDLIDLMDLIGWL